MGLLQKCKSTTAAAGILLICLNKAFSAPPPSPVESEAQTSGSSTHNSYNEPSAQSAAHIPFHYNQIIDYYSKPTYSYEYGVHDEFSGDMKTAYESRDGDFVQGGYQFLQPDGILRVVTYTSDPWRGFQTKVQMLNGHAIHPVPIHYDQHHPIPVADYNDPHHHPLQVADYHDPHHHPLQVSNHRDPHHHPLQVANHHDPHHHPLPVSNHHHPHHNHHYHHPFPIASHHNPTYHNRQYQQQPLPTAANQQSVFVHQTAKPFVKSKKYAATRRFTTTMKPEELENQRILQSQADIYHSNMDQQLRNHRYTQASQKYYDSNANYQIIPQFFDQQHMHQQFTDQRQRQPEFVNQGHMYPHIHNQNVNSQFL